MKNGYDLKYIQSEDDVNHSIDGILASVTDETGNRNKEKASKFLTTVLNHLDDAHAPLVSKFYTMMILVQVTERSQTKILSALSGHALLAFLTNLVDYVDPKKPVSEKGKETFKEDPQTGNKFIRITLECLKFWGQKFQKTRNDQPTKFRKGLNTLYQKRVVFPSDYIYFKSPPKATQAPEAGESNYQGGATGATAYDDSSAGKLSKPLLELRFTKNQFEGLMSKFENVESAEQIQPHVYNYHQRFVSDKKKYDALQQSILSENDENITQLYFKVMQLLNEEENLFNTHCSKRKDYQSYATSVQLVYDRIFGQEEAKFEEDSKRPKQIPQQNYGYQSTSSHMIATQKEIGNQKVQYREEHSNLRVMRPTGENPTQSSIKSLFRNLEERSKSPGFKAIKESLEKEKKNIHLNPPRMSRLNPRMDKSQARSLSKSQSRLKQSKIAAIFSRPPNPNPPQRIYEGKLIVQNPELSSILYEIKKDQGVRRFKIANFREKNPLFENNQIQVGYKSEAVYENIQNFKAMIAIELYIGNKTDVQIRNFRLQYKADSNQLLYAHPKVVDTIIPAGFQNKHQLMFVPLGLPFNFAYAKVQYEFKGDLFRTTIAIPNSILKLTEHIEVSRNHFLNTWSRGTYFKTSPFKLTHYFAPDSFQRWIPALAEMTHYGQFCQADSIIDYQLYCGIRIKNSYSGLLKINVRPNLAVVLQVSVTDKNDQAENHCKFYLETLQMALSHVDI